MSLHETRLFICEYCGNEYSSLSSLITHKKSAKFCLSIQNKEADNQGSLTCNDCGKVFTTKHTLSVHIINCKERLIHESLTLKNEINSLHKELAKLQDDITKKTLRLPI